MEAVPRLHMLWFALKSSPAGTSFANLKKYIAEFYHEDPESYSKEVFALETLRNQAMHPTKDGCSIMKRYYCQLHSLQNRFPQLSERNMFTFTWKDLYQSQTIEINDMRYEMAAVLFNIASSHTQVGASVTRGDIDGMKLACTHFQCAAWAFGELRERYADVNAHSDFMTPELLVFMQQVSFAQAQECILEKSLIDNRKPNIVGKVTAQIVVYYGAALAALLTGGDDGPVAQCVESSVYKLWKKYVRFKINYLNCILYLYQGQHAEEQQKMGERVTLYEAASEKLEDARKESKGLPDQKEINESLIFTADVVEAKRKNAKNENEFIYHETVPELSSITAIQGANLVNGIAFSVTDTELAGEDIFARLVPMKAHEASSMYSEEKAKLLRKYGANIEEKDTELSTFMSSLTLENLNINEEKANKIPQGIVDRCAALNANKSAIPELIHSMSQLADICSEVELNLKEIATILATEEREEREFQTTTGMKRTPNAHITELIREFQKYMEAHTRAGESNDTLRKAMELHVNNLKILARPLQEIQQSVPKLSTELNTNEIFKDVKLILNKVNEMKAQRSQFHADLRIAVNNDDITSKVIAHGSNEGEESLLGLFERELAKHERLTQLIDQNLLAQKNILQALTDSYAKAAPILKTLADVKHKRESFFSSLAASYDVYEDLLAKSAKGLEFYKKLSGNVQKLLTRLKSARDVQDEERQQRLKSGSNNSLPLQQQQQQKLSKDILPSVPTANASSHTPTLRDYLKAKNTSVANIAAGGFHDSNLSTPGVASTHNSTIPSIRPNPLGSETPTQAVCSGNYYPQIGAGTGIIAPNEPPPPYSLQQTQYYDPAAAGYTNPMYQQQQQNIAPPAYKLQASPNSQFTQLNTQFNQMGLTSGGNYASQHVSTQQQQQQIQLNQQQQMQLNQQQQMHLNAQQHQQQPLTNPLNGVAATLSGNFVGINPNNPSNGAVPNETTQQIYATAQNAHQYSMMQQSMAPSNIPSTQPLYVATSNNTDTNVVGIPLPITMLPMQVPAGQQTPPATFVVNTTQQRQATFQQQQLANQPMQSIVPQQMPLQQQSISSSNASMTTPSNSSNPSAPYGGVCSGSTKHPGYSFNPQSGQYEYGSGYQQAATANAPLYGQYTSATALKPGQNAGTTDSADAHKTNLATGFDVPIISHTRSGNATANTAASATSGDVGNVGWSYYTPQYGYHSHISVTTPSTTNISYQALQPMQQAPQSASPSSALYQQQQQQQEQQQQQQLQSIYMQSGGASIATTQTTKSAAEYALTPTQQLRIVSGDSKPENAAAPTPIQQQQPTQQQQHQPTQQQPIQQKQQQPIQQQQSTQQQQQQQPTQQQPTFAKKSSNIDLLSDIDLSLAGVSGIPAAVLEAPLLKPVVVPSPPSSHISSSPIKKPDNIENLKMQTELAAAIQPTSAIMETQENNDVATTQPPQQDQQQQQISSPVYDSPIAVNELRKSSYDNLSICSDLSSLDNFDFDSVSLAATQMQPESDKSNITTNTILNSLTPTSFLMKPYDPFTDDKTLKYFHKEVERFEKIIESLNVKMLNGNTQLSAKWKELQDLLSKDANKRTTSIAKLFPEKNRSLDCLPYDHARVKLEKNTDDYINAAFIKDLGAGCPNFIIAQTPLQNTVHDFWSMIWSQKARTVVCLHTPNEMLDPYWPQDLHSETHFDDFSVKCVKISSLSHCMEYNLKLSMHAADPIIDLSILQVKAWTKNSPTQTIAIGRNALHAHQHRCLELNTPTSPLIMNCLTGSDRSELLAIGICAILATQAKRPMLLNVVDVWYRICCQRQNAIRDTVALEQSMQIVLTHAHDVLNKRGIMTSYQMKIAPQVASKEKEEIKDPLNELDPLWKLK